jgi:hypothetical protein
MAKNGLLRTARHICAALALCALAGSFLALGDAAGAAERRKLALVVGNDAYENQPALAKAVGDAHAMRATLEKLGFEVRLAENLDYAGMVGALANFQSSIEPGDTVALHFSGHGVAANGRNYLLPVDFPQPESGRQGEVLLPRLAFDAGEIVDGLRSQGAGLTLAVFDACRDNALTSGTRSIGMSRGLVRMDPPRGVFVMFSAGPGELAADRLSDEDPAATSVFTRVFIPILETPGLTLVEIAKRTQVKVSELAATVDHQQFPDYSDRVIGDVVLLPRIEPETSAAPPAETVEPPPALPEVAAVAPTTTPPPSTPPLSSNAVPPAPSPADPDVALCDSVAADPYDPLLPASVDRSKLYDLERIFDFAIADEDARKSRPEYENLVLEGMPGAAVACEAAVKRHPEEKRLVYQQARAMCLSGMSEYCADAIKGLDVLGYPSALKFAAFALLLTVEDEKAAGGLSTMLDDAQVNEWFGMPRGDISDAAEQVQGIQEFLKTAGAAGDREASSLLLLFEEPDVDRRIAKLQDAGGKGSPIGLATVVTFVSAKPVGLTLSMRVLLGTAIANGSDLSRIMLLIEYEQNKSPEALQKAKDILTPDVLARSPTAAMILKKIEADVLALTRSTEDGGDAGSTAEASPPAEAPSPVDLGEKYKVLAGRDIWITVNPQGKAMAALVEQRLRAAGMNVRIDNIEERYEWDHNLDYEAKDTETAALVQELISDLYPMDLAVSTSRSIPNVTITPAEPGSAPADETSSSQEPASPVNVGDDRYSALAGRDIWITVNPNGKDEAALVEARLRAAGMNVRIDEVEEDYGWDGDLDYEAKDSDVAALVKELISDLYVMDLAIADTRSVPNVTITPNQ